MQDCEDPNPLIRALAVRTMGCIRVDKITEYLCEPLRKCLKDEDPYVRKTAAVCVAKLHDINAQLVEDQGFLDTLKDLISDSNPMVRLLWAAYWMARSARYATKVETAGSVFNVYACVGDDNLVARTVLVHWPLFYILIQMVATVFFPFHHYVSLSLGCSERSGSAVGDSRVSPQQ